MAECAQITVAERRQLRRAIKEQRLVFLSALAGDERDAATIQRQHQRPVVDVAWDALRRGERRMLLLLGELRENFGPKFGVVPDDDDDAEALHGLAELGLAETGDMGWGISNAGNAVYGGHHA